MARVYVFVGMLAWSLQAIPCTFLHLGASGNQVSAQNFDWIENSSLGLVVNKRNVKKVGAKFDGASDRPINWIAKYGSVTFGFGREQAIAGVNEVGLMAHRLLLMDSQYPFRHGLPEIQENFWLQYILDKSATVREAIKYAKDVRIYSPYSFPTHFAVCDQKSTCAVFEFLRGRLRITSGARLEVSALTNTDYRKSLDLLKECPKGDCPYLSNPKSNSDWRFVNTAIQLHQAQKAAGQDPVGTAWEILDLVKEDSSRHTPTLWTFLVHQDTAGIRVFIKNMTTSQVVAYVNLPALDFSCKSPAQIATFGANDLTNPSGFVDYTVGFQTALVSQMGTFFGVSKTDQQRMIEYPDAKTKCLD